MQQDELRSILSGVRSHAVGVIGDFCLDAYWTLDNGEPELSVETGKPTQAVRKQRYSLGGAGNIMANLADIGVGKLFAFAVLGDDLFGHEMVRQLGDLWVDCSGVVTQATDWDTAVYAKPYLGDEEQERLDFGRFNQPTGGTLADMLANLRRLLPSLDVLVVNQQLVQGLCSGEFIEQLNSLAREFPDCLFLADSRDYPSQFRGMAVKVNAREAAVCCGRDRKISHAIPPEDLREYAAEFFSWAGKPVIITRGPRGMLTHDGSVTGDTPGIQVAGRTDPVGAGDTACSALAACLAAGAGVHLAAHVANLAAAVTVKKVGETGTASPEEILVLADTGEVVCSPEACGGP